LFYAHSNRGPDGAPRPETEWEPLFTGTGDGHLERTAALAAQFAGAFNAQAWGHLAHIRSVNFELGLAHPVLTTPLNFPSSGDDDE